MSWALNDTEKIKSLDCIHCINNWPGPGKDADSAWKTPSRIAYPDGKKVRAVQWGFKVKDDVKSYTWMKLLLDRQQARKYDDPSLRDSEGAGVLTLPPDKDAVEVCADFLQEVARFCYGELKKRLSQQVVSVTPVEFYFTCPAVWTDRAQLDTLRAAKIAAEKAEIHFSAGAEVFLIREPEAAAIATIWSQGRELSGQQIKV